MFTFPKQLVWLLIACIFLLAACKTPSTTVTTELQVDPSPTLSSSRTPSPTLSPPPTASATFGNAQTQGAAIVGTADQIHTLTQAVHLLTHTATPSRTPDLTPSTTPEPTPTASPTATRTPLDAALKYLNRLCAGTDNYVSPDQRWVAGACEEHAETGPPNVYLRVLAVDRSAEWIIDCNAITKGIYCDDRSNLRPFRWSADGRFLYAESPSIVGGCCWFGTSSAVVRINLQTGAYVTIVNGYHDWGRITPFDFSISADDRFLMYFDPVQSHQLRLIDLQSWTIRVIPLKHQNGIEGTNARMSPSGSQVILILSERSLNPEYDRERETVLIFIDLETQQQQRFFEMAKEPDWRFPIQWMDEDRVELSCSDNDPPECQGWIFNVRTAELTPIQP